MAAISLLHVAVTAAVVVTDEVRTQFAEWQVKHGVTYASKADEAFRLEVFAENLEKIAKLDAADSAKFGPNKFADRLPDELRRLRGFKGGKHAREMKARSPTALPLRTKDLPDSFDWRSKPNVVNPIQDQASCGSCWAFSATANMESRLALKTGTLVKMSEQALVDCDHNCGTYKHFGGPSCDSGCNGGLQPNAFQYAMANGMALESAYPYQGVDGTCGNYTRVGKWTGWEFIAEDEAQIAAYLVANGPVAIAVDAANWSWYEGGVMQSWFICGNPLYPDDSLDHAVILVGYGVDNGTPYWIVRNSWGTSWGENGYARMIRGTGYCGVQLFACSSKA